jgi:hypothetical protein
MTSCKRCNGPKEQAKGMFCRECRRVLGNATQDHAEERARRRKLANTRARLMAGEPVPKRPDVAPEGTKWCERCQEFRPNTSFKDGAYCIPCQRSYAAVRRLMTRYGLTWDDYDRLFRAQGERCAICGGGHGGRCSPLTRTTRRGRSVDYCAPAAIMIFSVPHMTIPRFYVRRPTI